MSLWQTWMERGLGTLMVLIVLLDVYLTVLYARGGATTFSHVLITGVWRTFRFIANCFPSRRDLILSFAGPSILVVFAIAWVAGLVLGSALVAHTMLGRSIQATQGPTSTSYSTAVYFTGGDATTSGAGDLRPLTAPSRIFTVIMATIGISVITLMLTYFLQIYTALHQRTAFVLQLHHGTKSTGDAAELIARLGPRGDFSDGRRTLAAIAAEMSSVYEAHHFYSTLLYFRFLKPFYCMPRASLLIMDTVSLLCSALDPEEYATFIESSSVTQLWEGGVYLLDCLAKIFLPTTEQPDQSKAIDEGKSIAWNARFARAITRLQSAGIKTHPNPNAGAQNYISRRRQWHGYIEAFAHYLDHDMNDVDVAISG